jgi:hypothetical protein
MDEELYKERHLVECVRPAHSDQWRSGPHSTKSNATDASRSDARKPSPHSEPSS